MLLISRLRSIFPFFANAQVQALEQALDAVVSIDTNNCVTFFNAAAEQLWGIPRSQVL